MPLVLPSPPFASKVIVYRLGIQYALWTVSFIGTNAGTSGDHPAKKYPLRATEGAVNAVA